MINLGEAPQQKEAGNGPIPPKSIVLVKLEIRQPKAGKQAADDPAVTIFKSGLRGLDCEFKVVSGRFEGMTIWENVFLPPSLQTIALTKGQEGACNGGFAKMRAIIEAARNLDPNDPAADRNISSWFDLHSLAVPVKVGVQQPKAGDLYINNTISKVITPDMDEYQTVMAGGEIITEEEIPEIPAAPATAQQTPASAPAQPWGTQVTQQAAPPKTSPPASTTRTVNTPAWAAPQTATA